MNFKVGDKVKVVSFPNRDVIGDSGIITKVYSIGLTYPYRVQLNSWGDTPMKENELVPAIKVGEQLLLFEL